MKRPVKERARSKVEAADANLVTGKIRALLMKGAYAESVRTLESFLNQRKRQKSPFKGIRKLADVPLALAIDDIELLGLLEDERIRTIGHLESRSDAALREIEGIGPAKLNQIRTAQESLTREYLQFRVRQHQRNKSRQ